MYDFDQGSANAFTLGMLGSELDHLKRLNQIANTGWVPPAPVRPVHPQPGYPQPSASSDTKSVHAAYRTLLSQPHHVIAEKDANFSKSYDAHRTVLTGWLMSQKALKDLAYDLALSLGITEKRMDTIYLERLQEIYDGTNPNESIPESLKKYKEEAFEDIKKGLMHKYGGALPNEGPAVPVHKDKSPSNVDAASNQAQVAQVASQENIAQPPQSMLIKYKFRLA